MIFARRWLLWKPAWGVFAQDEMAARMEMRGDSRKYGGVWTHRWYKLKFGGETA